MGYSYTAITIRLSKEICTIIPVTLIPLTLNAALSFANALNKIQEQPLSDYQRYEQRRLRN